jgi:DNA-binding PucR family transcriptional regulator
MHRATLHYRLDRIREFLGPEAPRTDRAQPQLAAAASTGMGSST